MWRIFGLIFFKDTAFFTRGNAFRKESISAFCEKQGIALYDAAMRVIRGSGNASDKFMEVLDPIDLAGILNQIPLCNTVAVTGQKAAQTLQGVIGGNGFAQEVPLPEMGKYVTFHFQARTIKLYRMPSTSRAYPMSLEKKASYYKALFDALGMKPGYSHSMVAGGLEEIS